MARPSDEAAAGTRGRPGPGRRARRSGAPGPFDAHTAGGAGRTLSTAANVPVTVATLDNLPAGSYVLSSVAQAADFNNGPTIVSCYIRINGEHVTGTAAVIGNGSGSTRASVLSASGVATPDGASRATLECQTNTALAAPPDISGQRLTAIRVTTIHTQ